MGKTREIKGRIKAVSNIQRITKTMQMIATARFQAAQKRATASKPYATKISELVGELSSALASGPDAGQAGANAITHPLLQTIDPKINRKLVLVITSNRGLCGGYNASILRKSIAWLRDNKTTPIDLEVVGKKGTAFYKFNRIPTAQFHSQFTDKPDYLEVDRLAQRFMNFYTAGKYDSIQVVYMAFQSMARQSPTIIDLLPLRQPDQAPTQTSPPTTAKTTTAAYEFSPNPKTLLDELLPITVKTRLFQCFNEAVVGEQIARMVAMKAATDAAGKMKKNLTRKFNRARQSAITTELSEIISGAAALA